MPAHETDSDTGHDTGHDAPYWADRRLTDLELRYMDLEKLTHELSSVVAAQAQAITRLTSELHSVASRLHGVGPAVNRLQDDRPPHY